MAGTTERIYDSDHSQYERLRKYRVAILGSLATDELATVQARTLSTKERKSPISVLFARKVAYLDPLPSLQRLATGAGFLRTAVGARDDPRTKVDLLNNPVYLKGKASNDLGDSARLLVGLDTVVTVAQQTLDSRQDTTDPGLIVVAAVLDLDQAKEGLGDDIHAVLAAGGLALLNPDALDPGSSHSLWTPVPPV